METLRAAVIGCGGLGRHQAHLVQGIEGVELAAVCDVDRASAEAVAAERGCRAYESYPDLLAQEKDLDAVLVVTPTYTHKDLCVAVARAGCHIFCEKPMALRLPECDVMLQSAESHGVKLMIGFVRRFQPVFAEMKRRVEAGDLGPLKMLYTLRMGGRPPAGVGEWRKERRKVGGLFSAFIHEVDLLRWIGGEVHDVRGVDNFGTFPDTDVEDNLFMTLTFDSGAVGSLNSSQVYPIGAYDFGVAGTKGALQYGGDVNTLRVAAHGGPTEKVTLDPNDALRLELEEFFTALREDREPCITGLDGKKALEIVLAAYRSAEDGKIVRLPIG
jgi:scyllo-inositol 2-dehydrogenase (NAD+)